jgi:hypothetical protein
MSKRPSPPPEPPIEVQNRVETRERAEALLGLLERCQEELVRLEHIPTGDPDVCNALSAAKGYIERAQAVLGARFLGSHRE